MTLLRDKSGANAVEYAVIMALGAVFIISGLILTSTEMGSLFKSMGQCLGQPAVCTAEIFGDGGDKGGDKGGGKGGGKGGKGGGKGK